MGYYKFMDPRFVDQFINGRIRIGSLRYFRLLETVFKSAWIGDLYEGRQVYIAKNLDTNSPADAKFLRETRILAGDGSLHIDKLIFNAEYNALILSLAKGEYSQLASVFAQKRDGIDGYSACIEVVDIQAFLEALKDATVEAPGTGMDGKTVRSVTKDIRFGSVKYQLTSQDFRTTPFAPADPFIKRDIYSPQNECRVVIEPSDPAQPDHIFINMDVPRRCLKLIEHGQVKEPAPNDACSEEAAISFIFEAFRALDRIVEPDFSLVQKGRVTMEDYCDMQNKHSQEIESTFDKCYRDKIIKSYWAIRHRKPLPRLDDSLIRNESQMQVRRYIFAFLASIGENLEEFEFWRMD